MRHKLVGLFWALFLVALSIIVIINPTGILGIEDPHIFKQQILDSGALGPLLVIGLQTIQVVIFPIPGAIISFGAGFIFGGFWGGVYSLVGITLGSLIAFKIGRRFGRPFIERMIGGQDVEHWEKYYRKKEDLALFASRAVPFIMPNDLISYASSMTPIKFRDYALITFIGFIPHIFLLTFFGEQLAKVSFSAVVFAYALVFVLFAVFLIRIPLKKMHRAKLHKKN